jgi:hypothetical protein
MNLGSSELSASCLLSWSSLLASLAMCVVASTMRAACRVAIASSHRSVAARIAATERPENLYIMWVTTDVRVPGIVKMIFIVFFTHVGIFQ